MACLHSNNSRDKDDRVQVDSKVVRQARVQLLLSVQEHRVRCVLSPDNNSSGQVNRRDKDKLRRYLRICNNKRSSSSPAQAKDTADTATCQARAST